MSGRIITITTTTIIITIIIPPEHLYLRSTFRRLCVSLAPW